MLVLQSNSAGSVPTNDGTLGAEIRELKPCVAAPEVKSNFLEPENLFYKIFPFG